MNTDFHRTDDHGNSMLPSHEKIQQMLFRDGADWRNQTPPNPEDTKRRVVDVFRQNLASQRQALQERTSDISSLQEARPVTQIQALTNAIQKIVSPLFQTKRRVAIVTSSVLVMLLIAAFLAGILQQSPRNVGGVLPPPLFQWSPTNVTGNLSPQDAFARGVTLTPCRGQPAESVTVSWLGVNPHFGLALIQARCSQDIGLAEIVFVMYQKQVGVWTPLVENDTGITIYNTDFTTVPSWLPLPKDTKYSLTWTPGENPVLLRGWYSFSHLYLGGRIGNPVQPASTSQPVTIAGKKGWLVNDRGIVTILVPLSSEETYFFTATDSPQETQVLSADLLEHLDELNSIT